MKGLRNKTSNRFIRNLPDKNCPICGIKFHPRLSGTKLCSFDCRNKWLAKNNVAKKNKKNCEVCEKEFEYRPVEERRRFCSMNCYISTFKDRKYPNRKRPEPFTKEHRIRIGDGHKGLKKPPISEATRTKMSEAQKGKTAWNKGKEWIEKRGENHPMWIIDRTKLKKKQERNDPAYCEWRMNVWIRDNFRCRIDNQDCNGKIIAHHILGWSLYPELRYEVNNGITLCLAHHPRKRAEEKRLIPVFRELVSVLKV